MTTSVTPPATLTSRELRAWRNAVFVIFVLIGLCMATWLARLPAVRDELGLTTGTVGVLILGLSAGSIFGLIAAPIVTARFGPRRGILYSIFFLSVGLVIVGIGGDLVPFAVLAFIGLFIFGLGSGVVDVLVNVEGTAVERESRKTLLPLMHAFFSLGTVVGAGLSALASAIELSVFANLTAMAVLVAVAGFIAVRYIPVRAELADVVAHESVPKPAFRERIRSSLAVWKDLRLLLIGVVLLGMAFTEGSANDWIALATVDGHHQSNTMGALVFGVFVTAMTVGRVSGGPLLDRFGRVPVLRISALVGIAGMLMFILGTELWVAIVGTVLWGAGAALGFPVGMSAAADDERNATQRVSAGAMIGYLAFLAGPPLIGLLGEAVGILNAFYAVLFLLVLSFFAIPAARENPIPMNATTQDADGSDSGNSARQ